MWFVGEATSFNTTNLRTIRGRRHFEFHPERVCKGFSSICIPATQSMEGNEGRRAAVAASPKT